MKIRILPFLLLLNVFLFYDTAFCQKVIGLNQTILLGLENSYSTKIARTEFAFGLQEEIVEKKQFLPKIGMSGTLPAFSNSNYAKYVAYDTKE